MPTVSCLTVVHGPTPSLWAMLESLRRTTDPDDVETIVVAQPSNEGSMAAEIARRAPDVVLIDLDHNAGFGGGNDRAAARAKGELLAFLNPDLELTEGWLPPLVAGLGDPSVTIVAPPLIDGTGRVQEAGQVVFRDGWTFPIGGPTWPGSYDSYMFSRDVDYCSAACWLMRRDDFLSLGGFDTDYHPAYFEDVDLSFRVWRRGGRCRLISTRPVIHHHEPATESRLGLAQRSHGIFAEKWRNELVRQPGWPTDAAGWLVARDHRAFEQHVITIDIELDRVSADDMAARAGRLASSQSRDRITLRTARRPNLEAWRRAWCGLGLEIDVVDA